MTADACSRDGRSARELDYLYNEIDKLYHVYAHGCGVSDCAYWMLYDLEVAGGALPLSDLTASWSYSKQTINSALRKLEAEGAVYLEAVDGKAKMVCLTETGIALARRTALRLIAVENEILASWPEEALQSYLAGMERFLEDLRKKIPEL